MRNVLLAASVGFVALLIILPAGSIASEANLVATTGIPTKLYGDVSASATRALLEIEGAQALTLESLALELRTVRVTSTYVRVGDAIEAGGERRVEIGSAQFGPAQWILEGSGPGTRVSARGSDAELSVRQNVGLEEAPVDVWQEAHTQLGLLIGDRSVSPPLPAERMGQIVSGPEPEGVHVAHAGSYEATARGADATLAAVEELVLSGATLRGSASPDHRFLATATTRTVPGALYVPGPDGGSWTGPGTHEEESLVYFVLRPLEGRLSVASPGAIALTTDDLRVTLHGFVKFPWAEGTLRTPDETLAFRGEQVLLGGDLRLRPVGAELEPVPRLTLLGDGDVRLVQVGLAPPRLEAPEAAAVAGTAAAGLGLLALAVYYWPLAKYGASFALFPLYARVPKEKIFDHKGRELLYERILGEPGISTHQLAREVPFGWSTLTYHLRVLERNEVIVSVRDGRYKRFFDRQSGKYSNGKKFVLAVLKNHATLGIARFIREKPGSSQKEVAGTFALAPSSVHWHVERLSDAGLVDRVREAHNVKYFPGKAWDHVTPEDLSTLLPEAQPAAPATGPSSPAALSL